MENSLPIYHRYLQHNMLPIECFISSSNVFFISDFLPSWIIIVNKKLVFKWHVFRPEICESLIVNFWDFLTLHLDKSLRISCFFAVFFCTRGVVYFSPFTCDWGFRESQLYALFYWTPYAGKAVQFTSSHLYVKERSWRRSMLAETFEWKLTFLVSWVTGILF